MILHTPRLFLTSDDPRNTELGAQILLSLMTQWDIPCTVYCVSPSRFRERLEIDDSTPVHNLHDIPTASLHEPGLSGQLSSGGDLTLLLDASPSSGPHESAAREIASLTRSAVVRVVTSPDDATGGFTPHFSGAVDGHLIINPDDKTLYGFLGTADSPAPLAGDSLGLGDLLILGYRAPLLVEGDTSGRANLLPRTSRPRTSGRRYSGKALMIGGTATSVGKSLLTVGMCRYFAAKGLRVAPFKGQAMSNQTRVRVVDGGEISFVQYLQALASRSKPDVRMNPVIVKPREDGSDLIVGGRSASPLAQLPWRLRKPPTWPLVRDSLRSLCEDFDLVVIEGAGSIAEVGLYGNDIVNMRIAREAEAPVLLATNAANGGCIADCVGVWSVLPSSDRELLAGYIFNRFYRGADLEMLRPGLQQLERMTGVPVLGVVPDFVHDLPDPDPHSMPVSDDSNGHTHVAIVQYPHMSNSEEFASLFAIPQVSVIWAAEPRDFSHADIIILPATTDVAADLKWIRTRGIDFAVRSHARAGKRVLGICGGVQVLGGSVKNLDGVEGSAHGLGLLDLATEFTAQKIQRPVTVTFNALPTTWDDLSGLVVKGYEVSHGRSLVGPGMIVALPKGSGYASGPILGIYVHGLFENANVTSSLFAAKDNRSPSIERTIDIIAETLAESIDMGAVERLLRQ